MAAGGPRQTSRIAGKALGIMSMTWTLLLSTALLGEVEPRGTRVPYDALPKGEIREAVDDFLIRIGMDRCVDKPGVVLPPRPRQSRCPETEDSRVKALIRIAKSMNCRGIRHYSLWLIEDQRGLRVDTNLAMYQSDS